MFNLRVTKISKESNVETGERFLDVAFEIFTEDEESEVVATRRLGFPIETTPKQVKAELSKYLANFKSSEARKADQSIIDTEDKNADDVISKLEGLEL